MPTKQEEGREKWVHEDNLLNHRLTWLGVTQGLLFTTLGLVIKQSDPTTPTTTSAATADIKQELLAKIIYGVPIIGLTTSILILIGALAATIAMAKIKTKFELPEYGISLITTFFGWLCAVGIPYVFCVAWLLIITPWGAIFSLIIGIVIAMIWICIVNKNTGKSTYNPE